VICDSLVVFSINKIDRHDVTEILLKVALNTIKQTNKYYFMGSLWSNHINGVTDSVVASSVVDRGFESRSGQTKDL
jgi:hypothetical protein